MTMPSSKFLLCAASLALLPVVGCDEVTPPPNGTDDFTTLYQTAAFQMCADCHAPGAPGFTTGTETTQDWSTRDTAFASLQGNASGLIGNFAGCNGVPLVGPTANQSLIVAVFDADVRANFSYPGFPDCTADAIVDETLRVDPLPPADLALLKSFIDGGGFQ